MQNGVKTFNLKETMSGETHPQIINKRIKFSIIFSKNLHHILSDKAVHCSIDVNSTNERVTSHYTHRGS